MVERKDLIDLDNLGTAAEPAKSQEPVDDVLGGVPVAGKGKSKLDTVFDKYKKMIFLFDNSGSMGDGMVPDEIEKMYHWTPECLKKFREAMKNDLRKRFIDRYMNSYQEHTDQEIDQEIEKQIVRIYIQEMLLEIEDENVDEEALEKDAKQLVGSLSDEDREKQIWMLTYGIPMDDDFELKLLIIRQSLQHVYSIPLVATGVQPTQARKIEVMQRAASQFITERFAKCQDAMVMAFQFDDSPQLITSDCTRDGLLKAIQQIYPAGGTNIFSTISVALAEFKRAPSALGAHHIVLVTDGESQDGEMIEKELLPKLKDIGVVLDFIQIKGTVDWGQSHIMYKRSAEALKRVCAQTGGDYTEVNTPTEFTKKFLAAANRLLLGSSH